LAPLPRLTIRAHRPSLGLLRAVLLVAAAALAAWAVTTLAPGEGAGRLAEARADAAVLRAERDALAQENGRLRARVAMLERQAEIRSRAYAEVEEALVGLESEAADLREELAFYRGAVGQAGGEGRLALEGFRVRVAGAAGAYRFRAVLTRIGDHDTVVQGELAVRVAGEQGGHDAASVEAGTLPFRIRHFQRVEGRLELPEGFVPATLSLDVTAAGEEAPRIRRTYAWSDLAG
jgi:cell division protein FtsB